VAEPTGLFEYPDATAIASIVVVELTAIGAADENRVEALEGVVPFVV
jgi:hypothetical protein